MTVICGCNGLHPFLLQIAPFCVVSCTLFVVSCTLLNGCNFCTLYPVERNSVLRVHLATTVACVHQDQPAGVLRLTAQSERSQLANKRAALERFVELLRAALVPPPPPRRKESMVRV